MKLCICDKDALASGCETSGYHLIIYVTNNDSDDTFNSLLKYG